jgi:Cu/Ag efflux pump CusA
LRNSSATKASAWLVSANGFLTERVNETLSGYTAPVVINIFGNDLDQLDEGAGEIARLLGGVRGAGQIQIQSPPGMPQVVVRCDKTTFSDGASIR